MPGPGPSQAEHLSEADLLHFFLTLLLFEGIWGVEGQWIECFRLPLDCYSYFSRWVGRWGYWNYGCSLL
jgi:hypothetical protein